MDHAVDDKEIEDDLAEYVEVDASSKHSWYLLLYKISILDHYTKYFL